MADFDNCISTDGGVDDRPPTAGEEKRSLSPSPDEDEWKALVERLRKYKEKHGTTCLLTTRTPSDLALAAWIRNLRAQYKFLQLSADNDIRPNNSNSSVDASSTSSSSRSFSSDMKQRQGGREGKKNSSFPVLTWERVKELEDMGFEWTIRAENDATWRLRFEQLKEYQENHGDTLVPARYEENSVLGHWCMTQRRQFTLLREGKPSTLSTERFNLLESIGFSWVNRQGMFIMEFIVS